MSRSYRSFLFVPLTVAICSLAAGIYAPGLEEVSAATSEDDIRASLKSFTKIYELVEENYADPLNPDKAVYKGAVPGMLRTLDPHSNFFDPKDYQQIREDQRGRYYGVGMTVAPRNNGTVVIAPFPASPAYKAGIRPGDFILEVNDKKCEGLTTSEVADLLKGPRGTQVQVMVAREGVEKPITFNITRDEIPRKSVPDAFWLKPGIMYLDIESFNENTSKEVEDNFKRLGEKNVKGLILDLRENPGGLLTEGVAVADRFLQRGQTIVSHRGRASQERPYVARNGNHGFDYPIVVLVNRYSASAAEIVSGALQDHDRGWILGDNTFGKGLVQTVYPLSENTGLALTTAKYYTPSGRLIQRDYANTSFFDYYYRKDLETKN
nr:S41 family peptidase [Bryobacter sp.]